MRDRVFDIAGLKARIRAIGVSHQARRWQLALEGERGKRLPDFSKAEKGECQASVDQHSPQHSPTYLIDNEGIGERGECGECFSDLRACASKNDENNIKEEQTRSPHSPRSQNGGGSEAYTGERGGERQNAHSPHSPLSESPDWLKGVL